MFKILTKSPKNLGYVKGIIIILQCKIVVQLSDIVHIPSKKSSAQVGVQVNSVLTSNDYINCYILLFTEIILQQLDAFQTEI